MAKSYGTSDLWALLGCYKHDMKTYGAWVDWRSGKRRGLRTKGSLVRDLAATQFVVALSKSHLPTA